LDHRTKEAWKQEAIDFARAFSGAFIFGVPLLWTMEMWWIGASVEMWKLIAFMALVFVLNVYLAFIAGFREPGGLRVSINDVHEAIDAIATGVVTSLVVLLVLNRINTADSLQTILGKVIIQAIPLSIGASAARAVLGQDGEEEEPAPRGKMRRLDDPWAATLSDLGASVAGGVIVGFAIAPTEEIPMLAVEMTPWHLLALLVLSLVVSYVIVFVSGLGSGDRPRKQVGYFQKPFQETVIAYLMALLVAFIALYFFDQVDTTQPFFFVFTQVIVLGFPTALGGAAGRAII
jgi:putative integral membrane protein (TIGR02587 family)